MSGVHEVTAFLGSIGLDVCVQAVVHNGFYTSMEALKGATYEELVDSGVRPVHAKLIISHLGRAPVAAFSTPLPVRRRTQRVYQFWKPQSANGLFRPTGRQSLHAQ